MLHRILTADGLDPAAGAAEAAVYRERMNSGDPGATVFEGNTYYSRLKGGYVRFTAEDLRTQKCPDNIDEVFVFDAFAAQNGTHPFREVCDVLTKHVDGKVVLVFPTAPDKPVAPDFPLYGR